MMDSLTLLAVDEVKAKLSQDPQDYHESVSAFLTRHAIRHDDAKRSAKIQSWSKWCRAQTKRVSCVECDVPAGILPAKTAASLTDVKVGGGKKRVPDDALYNQHGDLREKVARGNTILYLNDKESGETSHDCLIFALKKFTGGMGDEDEQQPDTNKTWMDYFIAPLNKAEKVVCTMKANGEAAHFSVRWIKDRFIVCAGSKNVHLMARNAEDVAKYKDSRYLVAKTVASAVLRKLATLDAMKLQLMLSFMHHTAVTAVLEVLQPDYQHVVDLSHLKKPELQFIAFTLPFDAETNDESLCALEPSSALRFVGDVGFDCVQHQVIPVDEAENRMEDIRRGYNYEGEVLYFVDIHGNVIGLLKKKTAWYVLCRAIREKVSHALLDSKKCPKDYSHAQRAAKLTARLEQIQKWLAFSDEYLAKWTELGVGFLQYVVKEKDTGDMNVRGNFPILWNDYLSVKGVNDNVKFL